jgi:endo-1,4-beta-xylanase
MDDVPVRQKIRKHGRIRLIIGACAAALAAATVILPATANAATQVCSNQTGTIDGAFYTMFVSGGSACITLNSGTSYSTTWSSIGDFVGGIGSNPGSTSRTISFSNSLSASGGTTLVSLYGWSTNPLVEYYVEDNYVPAGNAAGTFMGTVTSDGGTYNIYEHQQVNQPSIQGTATFEQYLAIRTSPVSSGTITFGNFVNAWASHGMNLGTMNYQVLATESFGGGSGSSSVTLGSSSTPPPSNSPPPPSNSPPPPSNSPPPSGGGSCHVTYTTASQWTGGFVANVTIDNTSSSATNGWKLGFTFPGDQKITSSWNGTSSQSGESVTITNASYNGAIAAGGNTSIGFQGTWTNSDAAPSSFSVNGTACT